MIQRTGILFNRNDLIERVQWTAVTVTPSGISKSVTITNCHSNSVTLIVLNESGIAKTVTVADCHSNYCHSNRRPQYKSTNTESQVPTNIQPRPNTLILCKSAAFAVCNNVPPSMNRLTLPLTRRFFYLGRLVVKNFSPRLQNLFCQTKQVL